MNKKILIAMLAILPVFAAPMPTFAKGDKGLALHHRHHRHHHRHHHHHHHHRLNIVIR